MLDIHSPAQFTKEFRAIQYLYYEIEKEVTEAFVRQDFKKDTKTDGSTVTETDGKVELIITKAIQAKFPGDTILSEEFNPKTKPTTGRTWIVDPICGTYNFAHGIPFFTTNVSFWDGGKPKMSLVIDYNHKTYYWTSEKVDRIYNQAQPVDTTLTPSKHPLIFADPGILFRHKDHTKQAQRFADILRDLTINDLHVVNPMSSLGYTYAAFGTYAGIVSASAHPWDYAPAVHFFQIAAGIATDLDGKPWNLESTSLVASLDHKLHAKLLAITKSKPLKKSK